MSTTVTIISQPDEFPFISVTVKVTVLSPILLPSKEFGVATNEAIPQLSDDPLSMSAPVIVTVPPAKSIVISVSHTYRISHICQSQHFEFVSMSSVDICICPSYYCCSLSCDRKCCIVCYSYGSATVICCCWSS